MYLEKFNLTGRNAVVTGGGQAIGLACVEALAEAGAKVVIADHNPQVAETGRDAMKAKGYECDIAIVDVTDSKGVEALADKLEKSGGTQILVNNAGIARSETPAETVEDEHWLNVLDVNLNGTFWCCRSFGKRMLARKSGAIVNIGSMSGFIVNKPQEQSYYNASKAGVHHFASTRWRRPTSTHRSTPS
jgi:NAD(P)-dependent dehydrogenase (short-subunit alcohol dehydrogenase family)